jgi:hypothetical protein
MSAGAYSVPSTFMLLNDQPARGSGGADVLGTQAAAVQLAGLIEASRNSTPFTLGIDAGWGMGYDNPEVVRSEYDAGNDVLWNIIRRAARIRLTSDVRLEPISSSSADVLYWLYKNGAATLDNRLVGENEMPLIAADLGRQWDTGRGYSWLAYWRKGKHPAIGYGELVRKATRGADQFVLHCAVLPDERRLDCAEAIVKAMLAFARNEVGADQVSAHVAPPNRWAMEIMSRAGMRYSGAVESGGRHVHAFSINLRDAPPSAISQAVVTTGIGQILAVPG